MRKTILAAVVALCLAGAAHAERPAADLARDATSKPQEMLALMKVQPNMTVLDLLGGNGYFSEVLDEKMGDGGKVLLHNNKAYMPFVGKDLEARVASGRMKHVVRYDRELSDLGLEENSVDAVFFVMGYHDMYHTAKEWKIDPANLMGQVKKALKPGGLMLVVDHSATPGSKTALAQDMHRIDDAFVKEDLARFGFELVAESDLLRNDKDLRRGSVFDPAIRGKTDRFVYVVRNKK